MSTSSYFSSSYSSSSSLLIPPLPNDLSSRILSMIPFPHHAPLKQTSKSWNQFFSSPTLIPLRHHLRTITHLICLFPGDPSVTSPLLFDVHSLAWRSLPLMPSIPNTCARCSFSAVFLFPHLYILGGTMSTTHHRASSSSSFRFDFITGSWHSISPMLTPRGSFACAAFSKEIVVAGGWLQDEAGGRRMSSAESYDVVNDEWEVLEELPEHRAGCIGFMVKEKFWVMGGNRESMNGVFSTEVYCKDGVAMDLKNRKWREVRNMQADGRVKTGNIAVVENEEGWGLFAIFMLHQREILRYDMASNSWLNETTLPTNVPNNLASVGFIALGKELVVMSVVRPYDPMENWRLRRVKRIETLQIQIYHPRNKTWRSLQQIKPPFTYGFNFRAAVMCTVQI